MCATVLQERYDIFDSLDGTIFETMHKTEY